MRDCAVWVDERTREVEVLFIVYAPCYGIVPLLGFITFTVLVLILIIITSWHCVTTSIRARHCGHVIHNHTPLCSLVIRYNGNYALFDIVRLTFEFELGGRMTKELNVDTVDLELTQSADDVKRMFLELLTIIGVALTLLRELKEFYESQRKTGNIFAYFDFWHVLELISLGLYGLAGVSWGVILFIIAPTIVRSRSRSPQHTCIISTLNSRYWRVFSVRFCAKRTSFLAWFSPKIKGLRYLTCVTSDVRACGAGGAG